MARRFKHLIPVHLSIIEKIDDSETIIDISYVMLCGEQNNVRFWHKAAPHNYSQATPAYQTQPFENPDTFLNC